MSAHEISPSGAARGLGRSRLSRRRGSGMWKNALQTRKASGNVPDAFLRAPGTARILPVKDWSQVSIAKRSERQAGDSNVMGGGSHVAKL